MSTDEDYDLEAASTRPAGASLAAFAGLMAALTIVAMISGGALGARLGAVVKTQLAGAPGSARADAQSAYSGGVNLQDLPPIIANLAEPSDAWVRLQATLVLDRPASGKPDVLAAQIAEDILGFMRTATLSQIAGASGLQHLREDLNERAMIRSDGRVRELILQTLVVQ
ncbi:flagellar basal body-associated protein FliL [Methylocella silvestris BL2]|uniref:Flagellar protein FliL n=1 Tax=Methylocella silvestris (strain DSM 15510 / CIP 108128 / LMG 27833 / NCIMB 13906 / BL2) TaxID=395965 RepID=B8EL20_METSB|nr:flagellar basal body-associated FliL family protein [Methylocella silvestris]ACK49015.1 flagellar basal body-associated protein FliL [Methylocella silvestris BL2]